jgi:hypothetical protein
MPFKIMENKSIRNVATSSAAGSEKSTSEIRENIPQIMRIEEASWVSTLSPRTLRNAIAAGKLQARRVGRRLMIVRQDLGRFLGVELN